MEIKNRKSEFKPITKIGNKCIIRWDFKPITKINNKGIEVETPLAVWQEETFNFIPNLDQIKEVILSYYNKQIDDKIIGGFVWKNMNIWLSSENQFNYNVVRITSPNIYGSFSNEIANKLNDILSNGVKIWYDATRALDGYTDSLLN